MNSKPTVSRIDRLKALTSVGALFASVTKIVKLPVAERDGLPSSLTRTVTVLVPGPCSSVGVQLTRPSSDTLRPAGPDTNV